CKYMGLQILSNFGFVAAEFMAYFKPFTGALPQEFERVHLPSLSMWLPPLVLGVLGVIFGCLPALAGYDLTDPASNAIFGQDTGSHLRIWHGFNLVLLLSIATLLAGTMVYIFNGPSTQKLA